MENKDIEIFYRINLSINYSKIALIYSVKLTDRKILGILGRMNKILLLWILIKQNINKRRPLVISFYFYLIKFRRPNKLVYQLFHNSTKFFCKTDRQGNIRNIGKDKQNITFVYFDKVKYK